MGIKLLSGRLGGIFVTRAGQEIRGRNWEENGDKSIFKPARCRYWNGGNSMGRRGQTAMRGPGGREAKTSGRKEGVEGGPAGAGKQRF